MSPKLSKLNNAEREWIADNLSATREMIGEFSSESSDIEPSALDAAYSMWLAQHDPETEDPNPVINAFGIAFGQYLVDHLQLQWIVASDKYGTEMAVHGQSGDILVYPANLVGKRYTTRETDFFAVHFAEFQSQIEMIRSQAPERPWWKFW
jgi:Domain of unknown function (DUF3806)